MPLKVTVQLDSDGEGSRHVSGPSEVSQEADYSGHMLESPPKSVNSRNKAAAILQKRRRGRPFGVPAVPDICSDFARLQRPDVGL